MKKILGTALAAGAAMVGMAGSANAAVAFNVGIATDYVFRGIDQFGGDNKAELFGGADWTSANSQFYLGTWVSNTNTSFAPGAHNVEVDVYGGWKPTVGPVALDLGVIGYIYTDTQGGAVFDSSIPDFVPLTEAQRNTSKASNFELKAAGSVPLGAGSIGAKVFWTPNFGGDYDGLSDDDGWYYEVNAAYTFKNKATLSGAVGQVHVSDFSVDSYITANVGVTYPIMDHLSIDGRVIQNSKDAEAYGGATADDTKVVGTLTVTF